MSDDDLPDFDEDDLDMMLVDEPSLDDEEGRDAWITILAQQDDETLKKNGMAWIKALIAVDDDNNMVARFIYEDGQEQYYDLKVRRVISIGTESDSN